MENIKELDALCTKFAGLRDKKTALNAELKGIQEELDKIEAEFLEHLEAAELDGFDGSEGRLSIVEKMRVTVPKSVEDKKALAKYLEKKKIFWELFGINSQTLNSFYNAEADIAKDRGDADWSMPGVNPPSIELSLQFRRK